MKFQRHLHATILSHPLPPAGVGGIYRRAIGAHMEQLHVEQLHAEMRCFLRLSRWRERPARAARRVRVAHEGAGRPMLIFSPSIMAGMESRQGTKTARRLRTACTDAELALWQRLRARRLAQLKFRRQFPVSGYVVDFACLEVKLVVEVDGGQHAERVTEDAQRTAVLEKNGFRVLRFWDNDVLKDLDAVLAEILRCVEAPPSPQPSPASGRGG